jgi:stage V sporulation protein B
MAGVSYLTYTGSQYIGAGFLGTGNVAGIIYLAIAILVGIVVYAALIVLTRAITRDDLSHIPKGDKFAKLLRVK